MKAPNHFYVDNIRKSAEMLALAVSYWGSTSASDDAVGKIVISLVTKDSITFKEELTKFNSWAYNGDPPKPNTETVQPLDWED